MKVPRSRAFTLIESVAALAVASIALLALLQLQLVSINTADKAEGMTRAVLLAQEKMAEILSMGHSQVGTTSGYVEANGDQFAWQMEVADARLPQPVVAGRSSYGLSLGSGSLRQLTVDVTWQKGPGDRHISLTTYMAENAICEERVQKASSR